MDKGFLRPCEVTVESKGGRLYTKVGFIAGSIIQKLLVNLL